MRPPRASSGWGRWSSRAAHGSSRSSGLSLTCPAGLSRSSCATTPPSSSPGWYALEDTALAGVSIPAGSAVLLLLGAANRDPGLCPDPDQLRVDREPTRHLAFGHGIHFCLGAPLARLEAQIVFRSLAEHFTDIALAGTPEWKPTTVLRGLRHLPLALRR
jgi:cytochrome P450